MNIGMCMRGPVSIVGKRNATPADHSEATIASAKPRAMRPIISSMLPFGWTPARKPTPNKITPLATIRAPSEQCGRVPSVAVNAWQHDTLKGPPGLRQI
jgi:hypothetical protein